MFGGTEPPGVADLDDQFFHLGRVSGQFGLPPASIGFWLVEGVGREFLAGRWGHGRRSQYDSGQVWGRHRAPGSEAIIKGENTKKREAYHVLV